MRFFASGVAAAKSIRQLCCVLITLPLLGESAMCCDSFLFFILCLVRGRK